MDRSYYRATQLGCYNLTTGLLQPRLPTAFEEVSVNFTSISSNHPSFIILDLSELVWELKDGYWFSIPSLIIGSRNTTIKRFLTI